MRGDVDGVTLCRMFNTAIATENTPHHLSSDNDPLFLYHRWQANLRILEIEEIKSNPHTPTSYPFIERLIGTIRREYLDHIFFNAHDLERKLKAYRKYYNQNRVHQSLAGDTPAVVARQPDVREKCRQKEYLGSTVRSQFGMRLTMNKVLGSVMATTVTWSIYQQEEVPSRSSALNNHPDVLTSATPLRYLFEAGFLVACH